MTKMEFSEYLPSKPDTESKQAKFYDEVLRDDILKTNRILFLSGNLCRILAVLNLY